MKTAAEHLAHHRSMIGRAGVHGRSDNAEPNSSAPEGAAGVSGQAASEVGNSTLGILKWAGKEFVNAEALDAQFKEGEHSRDPDGKFGSNNGTPQNAYSAEGTRKLNETQASKIPFVAAVFREHQTSNKIRSHLTTIPTEKLKTAEQMLNEHANKNDGQANSLKIWISREINARADRSSSGAPAGP